MGSLQCCSRLGIIPNLLTHLNIQKVMWFNFKYQLKNKASSRWVIGSSIWTGLFVIGSVVGKSILLGLLSAWDFAWKTGLGSYFSCESFMISSYSYSSSGIMLGWHWKFAANNRMMNIPVLFRSLDPKENKLNSFLCSMARCILLASSSSLHFLLRFLPFISDVVLSLLPTVWT